MWLWFVETGWLYCMLIMGIVCLNETAIWSLTAVFLYAICAKTAEERSTRSTAPSGLD